MNKPDYKGASLVNLMSSIIKANGGKSKYKELKLLPSKELEKTKNIVLIAIDGLGYNYIKKHGKGSIFEKYLKGKITSVFPTTTAAAMTTINTGDAPQEHGLTGWFTYLKELGLITMPLPFKTMVGGVDMHEMGLDPKTLLKLKPINEKITRPMHIIQYKKILKNSKSQKDNNLKYYPYKNLKGFFKKTIKAIKKPGKKYIHAYWPDFDEYAHVYGLKSKETSNHFKELATGFENFLEKIKGTDTQVILIADHGMIDIKKENIIFLEEYPEIKDCLSMPMSGDMFVKYCYVNASKAKKFEKLVKKHLSKYCRIYKSENLIKNNYFGLGKPNPKLIDRIGDYTLIAKKDYVVDEIILGENNLYELIGRHSGLTDDELYVPLVVVKL